MKYLKIILIFIFSAYVLSCSFSQNIDYIKLKEIAKKENTIIIDVRSPTEFGEGHITNSINIPLDILTDSIESLKRYEHIILVCRSGNRSGKAKELLENKYSFNNSYNGGGWKTLEKELKNK